MLSLNSDMVSPNRCALEMECGAVWVKSSNKFSPQPASKIQNELAGTEVHPFRQPSMPVTN